MVHINSENGKTDAPATDSGRLAELLLSRFRGRADKVALGTEAGTFRPQPLRSPMQASWMRKHLAGEQCLGFYLMTPESEVWCSCVDFDDKPEHPDPEWMAKAATLYTWLGKAGLAPVAEVSASGRGAHVWLFFEEPTEAWVARSFWRLAEAKCVGPFKEIYPRQDVLAGKGLGNLVRYPLWNLSRFADPENDWAEVAPAEAMSGGRTSGPELKALAASMGCTLRPGPKPAGLPGEAEDDDPAGLSPRALELLARKGSLLERRWNGDMTGLKDESRSSLVLSIACELVRQYVPSKEVAAAVRSWCEENGYAKGEREEWVARTVERAYEFLAGRREKQNGGGDGSQSRSAGGPKAEAPIFSVGPFTLRPGPARRTPAGVVKVPVAVLKDGGVAADFLLSSTPSSWRGPARVVEQLLKEEAAATEEDKRDVEKAFRRIVADASGRADAPPAAVEGPTVESIVRERVPAMWQLKCRTDKGAWSEEKPGEVSRGEFTSFVPDDLMEACGRAVDAPRLANGLPARQDLLRHIQTELLVSWSSVLRALPPLPAAKLGESTAAGRQFRSAMVRLWTSPGTWVIPKEDADSPGERVGATKASLVSRMLCQRREWGRGGDAAAPREAWRKIHPALSAWWRVAEVGGEVLVFLAMRWDLANAVKQPLPGVTDQVSLNVLGKQFGVTDPAPPVSANLSGRKARLAVLSRDLTEELLAVPDENAAGEGTCDERGDEGGETQ